MKFVVCVKLTPDTEQLNEIRPEDVESGELDVTLVLNPWDEFAVEEALLLQDRFEGETVAITLGDEDAAEALKRAVAMGIEEAHLVSDPSFADSDPWGVAHILAQTIRGLDGYDLILTGRQSVDGASGLVAAGLAAKLGVPFVSQVAKVVDLDEQSVTVLRSLDEGMQTVRVHLPAVISVSKEINEPRYPNFMGIRKASRMSFPAMDASSIAGLSVEEYGAERAKTNWTNLRKPPQRSGKCEFIEGATVAEQAATLADKLIAAKVI